MVAAIACVPRAQPRIDLGVGDSRDAQGLGQWQPSAGNAANTRWVAAGVTTGTSTWNGEEPHWVDITCYGIEVETFTGRDRATDQWEVGTATVVLDNTTGWADYPPTTTPNPFDLTVRPGRQVRVAVSIDDGAPQVLWRGFVDQANPGFDAEVGDIVTLECIDAKGEAGRADIPAVDPPVGSGETIQARLNRICTGAAWPTYWRHFEGTGLTVVGTELGEQTADLLNRAADSGGGSLFGDVDGKLRYRNRDWQLWPADDVTDARIGNIDPGYLDEYVLAEAPAGSYLFRDPDGVLAIVEDPEGSGLYYDANSEINSLDLFGDPPGTGLYVFGTWIPGDYCPTSWEMSFAREDITTRVLVGRPDMDEPIVVDDEEAQDIYGVESLDLTDLETTLDTEMTQIANRLLVIRGISTAPRVAGVTLNAATAPDMVTLLSTADPRTPSRYVCRHDSGDRRVFSRIMFCTAIRHTIGPDLWEARLSLDDALPWQVGGDTGFWHDTETTGAGHWQESKWQPDIAP